MDVHKLQKALDEFEVALNKIGQSLKITAVSGCPHCQSIEWELMAPCLSEDGQTYWACQCSGCGEWFDIYPDDTQGGDQEK